MSYDDNEYYDDDDEYYDDDEEEYFDADEGEVVRRGDTPRSRIRPSGLTGDMGDSEGGTGASRFGARPSGAASGGFDRESLRARFAGATSGDSGGGSTASRLNEIRSGRTTSPFSSGDDDADADADDETSGGSGASSFRFGNRPSGGASPFSFGTPSTRGDDADEDDEEEETAGRVSASPFSFGNRPSAGSSSFRFGGADDDDDEADDDDDDAAAANARRARFGTASPFNFGNNPADDDADTDAAADAGAASPFRSGPRSPAGGSSFRFPTPSTRGTADDADAGKSAPPSRSGPEVRSGASADDKPARAGGGFSSSGGNKPAAASSASSSSSINRPAFRPSGASGGPASSTAGSGGAASASSGNRPTFQGMGRRDQATGDKKPDEKPASSGGFRTSNRSASSSAPSASGGLSRNPVKPEPLSVPDAKDKDAKSDAEGEKRNRFGGLGRNRKQDDAGDKADEKPPAAKAEAKSPDKADKPAGEGEKGRRFGGLGNIGRGNKSDDAASKADEKQPAAKAEAKKPDKADQSAGEGEKGRRFGGLGNIGRGNKSDDAASKADEKPPAAKAEAKKPDKADQSAGEGEKGRRLGPFSNIGRGNKSDDAASKAEAEKPVAGTPFGRSGKQDQAKGDANAKGTSPDKSKDKGEQPQRAGFAAAVTGGAAGALRRNKGDDQPEDAKAGKKADQPAEAEKKGRLFGRRGKDKTEQAEQQAEGRGKFANADKDTKQSARGKAGKQETPGEKVSVGQRVGRFAAGLFQGGPMDDDQAASASAKPRATASKSSSKSSKPGKGSKAAAQATKVPQVEGEGLTLDNYLDIAGVLLVFGALVYFFIAVSSEQALLSEVHVRVGQLFGWGSLAVPMGMFLVGMWLIVRHFGENVPKVDPIRVIGIVIGFIAVLVLLQYVDTFNYTNITSEDILRLRLDYAWREEQTGGGYIGVQLYTFLYETFTEVGGFLITLLVLIVAWMLAARSSMTDIIRSLISVWWSMRDGVRKRADTRRAERALAAQRAPEADLPSEIQVMRPQAQATANDGRSLAEPAAEHNIRINAGGQAVQGRNPEQAPQYPPQPAYGYPPMMQYPGYAPGYPPPQQAGNRKGLLGGLLGRSRKNEQQPPQMPPVYYPPYMLPPGFDPAQYAAQMQQMQQMQQQGQQAPPMSPANGANAEQPAHPQTPQQPPVMPANGATAPAENGQTLGDLLRQASQPAANGQQPAAEQSPQPEPTADATAQAEYERLQRLRTGQEGPLAQPPAAKQPQTPAPAQPPRSGGYNPLGRPDDIPTHPTEKLPFSQPPALHARPQALPDDTPPSQLPSAQPAAQVGPYQQSLSIDPQQQQQPRVSEAVNQTRARRPSWNLPDYTTLLSMGAETEFDREHLLKQARIIEDTLAGFSAPGRVVEVNTGPVVTQFGVEPDYISARGGKKQRVKVSAIAALDRDLQLALGARSIRVEAPVPGKGYVGVEVPNEEQAVVRLRDVMEDESFKKVKSPLAIALGQSVAGTPVSADLSSMPHLLIAGTTGSGKSVCVNSIIISILTKNSPEQVRFIMVDPKRVELTGYNGIPHLVAPVVVELERIVGVLKWVTREMDERYKKFSQAGARNITDYNKHLSPGQEPMPYIVVIIDELADLMMLAPEETERAITRIAALARATGIHLVIATQRPSVDVVTGTIKANFPARIAFAVAGGVDSRVILDQPGAERLLGRGDMLYLSGDAPAPQRLQGVFVSDMEIDNVVRYWKMQSLDHQTGANISSLSQPVIQPEPVQAVVSRAERTQHADFWVENAPAGQPSTRALFDETTLDDDFDVDDDFIGADAGVGGDGNQEDELYEEAVELVRRLNKASVSLLQRRLRIGYTRAARLIDVMEARGVVGPAKEGSSKPRDVLPEP